ncbi:hypothetical protein LTR53_010546, partial [Teratosphaeriaceae sp. CCFEE 6253]
VKGYPSHESSATQISSSKLKMLTNTELESSSSQLAAFRLASTEQHASLTSVLESYAALVEDYKRLQSDYEEERESRERYKQLARGQERNPFVLVLVDGDGYIFDGNLICDKENGGQRAAQLLDDAIKRSLRDRGLEQCRIMVRIYANVSGLSKALSKVKLVGPEKRSLAPFAANFTRTNDLFDLVDAGELKENADAKLRALFRLYVDNSQCKHIFFAGCHDVGYINELTPHTSNNRDRITLVGHPALHHEFTKLGLRIEQFPPGIFRSSPLDMQYAIHSSTKQGPPPSPHRSVPILMPQRGSMTDIPQEVAAPAPFQRICRFFQTGNCIYGNNCKNLHIKDGTNGPSRSSFGNLMDVKKWRDLGPPSAPSSFQMGIAAQSSNVFAGGQYTAHTRSSSHYANDDALQNRIDFITQTPGTVPAGQIPVNVHNLRIDNFPAASPDDFHAYTTRTANQKLCNNLHLKGYCPKSAAECPYDHTLASVGVVDALRQLLAPLPALAKEPVAVWTA